ncbi:MAG TPA: fatty acid desaturase [Candidatus Binatia bacterium]|jgi:fatty acid desaturase
MPAVEALADRSLPVMIPARLNLSLAAFHVLANVFQFFILPLVLLPKSLWWALFLLPLAALNNPFWSLIHEGIHDMLHPSRRVNRALGRLLAYAFGAPFLVLRLSHLLHHKLNRSLIEATEIYAPESRSHRRAALGYFAHIFGGLYLLELASPLMFFLPRAVLRRMEKKYFMGADVPGNLMRGLMREQPVREMRIDGIVIIALLAASAWSYGVHWPLLAAALCARAFLISFLDNVYHYATPVGDTFYARNLSLPRAFSAGLLHFNFHGIHHRNPAVPWTGLPAAFRQQRLAFDSGYATAALEQLGGPIPQGRLLR